METQKVKEIKNLIANINSEDPVLTQFKITFSLLSEDETREHKAINIKNIFNVLNLQRSECNIMEDAGITLRKIVNC